jgi:hypothetical protein
MVPSTRARTTAHVLAPNLAPQGKLEIAYIPTDMTARKRLS